MKNGNLFVLNEQAKHSVDDGSKEQVCSVFNGSHF
jgi:hypothetical protein